MTDRNPPNDEHAERALLGHTLSFGRIPETVNGLAPSDFYRPNNETIWAAMRSLSEQGKPCDLTAVRAYLQERGKLDTRGGVPSQSLVELTGTPPIADPAYTAEIIRERSLRRQIIQLHERGLQRAYESVDDPDAQLRRTEEDLGRISGHGSEPTERRTWQPVDLGPVLDGTWQPPEPTIGLRDDGKGLFYAGKCHTVISETEGGKTWLALCACLDEMHAGNHVLYVDFEDDEGGVVGRLLTLGASRDLIAERFHYLRPESPLSNGGTNYKDLREVVQTYRPTLDILDGITEAMTMLGLNPLDNVDAATFGRKLPRPLAAAGAAVANLDHVTKDREGRGKYAIGAVHKLNALDGGAYTLENRDPFGVGITGRSTIKISKDRPGQLRCNALPSSGGLYWYGDLVLKSHDRDFAEVSIEPPHGRDGDFRPTVHMTRISEALTKHGAMSGHRIELAVTGKAATIRDALGYLILDGYVTEKSPHSLIKPYTPKDQK